MTTFNFQNYQNWISKNCHYYRCGIAPDNDTNINHASLIGERLNHPRIFRSLNTSSRLLSDVDRGGMAQPYKSNIATDVFIYILNTERFEDGQDIIIQDNDGWEIQTITGIVENKSLQIGFGGLDNAYDKTKLYTVSTLKDFTLDNPDEGSFTEGDYVRLGTEDDYLIRIIREVDTSNTQKTIIKCGKVTNDYSEGDLISVLFPVNGITPEIDDAIIIPEKTFPFNPQQFGIKAGSLHKLILKDVENNEIEYNSLSVESQAALEYGAINLLFTPDADDFAKFAQNLDFDNPMIMPGLNTETFDYSSDADMQLIWKGTTTTRDTNRLKWTYNNNSIHALFPLPLDFVARSSGDNELTMNITGTPGNTGTLAITLYSADGESFTYDFVGDLEGSNSITIDFDLFTGKQFVKRIEFEITSGSGILYLDNVTPFKVPNFDDVIGNPAGVKGTGVGSIALYYDVREAPIHALTANAAASEQISIQLTLADTSEFVVGDKIVLYDLNSFEFAEVDIVDVDGIHITVTPVYGTFFYDYTTADYASIQLLTYKVRNIAGAYSIGTNLQTWTKTAVLIEGDGGEWDEDSVFEPSVLFKNAELYLSYTGKSGAAYGIGFARSIDFLTFTKLPENPYLNSYDNSKIIELNGFEGITARDSSNDIKLLEQKTGFLSHLDFHVTILVRPDSSLGYPDEPMVLYDQGNFKITVNRDYTLKLSAYFDGQWNHTPADEFTDDDDRMRKCWGTQLTMDHWNLIVAQTAGDKIGIYKIGLITSIPNKEYFTLSPWVFYEDMAGGATSFAITLRGPYGDDPVAEQSVYIWSAGTESDNEYDQSTHWQLNRIETVTERDGFPGVFDCDLLYPIGPWGFAKETIWGDMGPVLAQGQPIGDFPEFRYFPPSGDGEFKTTEVNEMGRELSIGSSGQEQVLDSRKFAIPKIGSAIDGSHTFNKGLIGFVDVANDILDKYKTNEDVGSRLHLFAYMIQSSVQFLFRPFPEWWEIDISGIGTIPTMNNPVAYWDFSDWDNTMVPDSAFAWDLYNSGATFVVDTGYGYSAEFDKGDYLFVYKYSNLEVIFSLLESITGPSEVETPINLIPQLFADGVALISTIEGKTDYYIPGSDDPDDHGYIVIDLFESTELPSSLDIDSIIYNPSNCSMKLYISVTKITDFGESIKTYDSTGFVTIDETIDLTPYESEDELIYNVRLKLELISDGVDTTEIVEIQASATGIVDFPSAEFIDTWTDINSVPCLKVELIDDTGTHYDVTFSNNAKIIEIPNLTYGIPIHLDDESQILPSEITINFENYGNFWNPNNVSSPLNGKNYLEFRIIIFAGFNSEYTPQGVYKIERVILDLDGSAKVSCSSEFREILDQKIGFEEPQLFPGIKSAKDIIREWLKDYGGISPDNIYFEDSLSDYFVSNVELDNQTIISVLKRLAAAANYLVFIDAQGNIRVINRSEMDTSGRDYTEYGDEMSAGEIITGATLTGPMRKNLIKKARVLGSNNVSVTVENVDILFGRDYSLSNEFIYNSDEATVLANQLISDYGLNKKILDAGLKYSPHLKLLDILTFLNPITGAEDSYMIMSINRNLTSHTETITAILI